MRRDVGIGHRHLAAKRVWGERDDVELDLLVAAAELVGDLLVGDRHPPGDRRAQLVDEQRAAQVVLEFSRRQRRVVELEHLPIPRFADESPVLLERRHRQNALAHFRIAHREALAARFSDHGLFIDHLLQDLLLDPELAQQLLAQLRSIGVAVRLQLGRVAALEVADGDLVAFYVRQDLRGRRARAGVEEAGNVEDHEGQDDEREAPLEPAFVAPHPVEHCHSGGSRGKPRS